MVRHVSRMPSLRQVRRCAGYSAAVGAIAIAAGTLLAGAPATAQSELLRGQALFADARYR